MLHNLTRIVLALLLGAVLAPASIQAAPRLQPDLSALETAPCMFDVPADRVEGQDLLCGYLTVPLRHAEPDGETIDLAVVIIKSRAVNPEPDPLVMLQGGPGGSTIDIYTQLLLSPTAPSLNRDVILFDQRGTLYSRPSLICDEFFRLTEETIEQNLSDEEAERLSDLATEQCRQRLAEEEGIDLAPFNSLENAADVEALRLALGYDQINLYGVSYGTLLAQHVMRNHPEGLRTVILDAVVPTATNPNVEVGRSIDRSLSELFAACEADPGCAAAYPNLEQVLFETVDRLNAEPALIRLTDTDTGQTYDKAVMNGDSFYSIVFQLLYASDILPALPRIIYNGSEGDFSFLAQTVLPQIVFDRTLSLGMYHTVTCAEDADFQVEDIPTAGLRPLVAEDAVEGGRGLLETCTLWNLPQLDASVDAPVISDIPTLVLSGRFDPVTPPPFAEQVAANLSRSYSYVFGNVGHGAFLNGPCSNGIVQAFLDNPDAAPDGACIDEKPAPEFVSPATVLLSDAPQRLISGLLIDPQPAVLGQVALLGLTLLFLLTALLIFPLLWLVRRLSSRPAAERQAGAGLARWAALLVALLGLVFVVGLARVAGTAIFSNDLAIFFGFPRSASWLFVLPLVLLLLTVGMIVFSVLAWTRGYWSALSRVYYTLLTLAAVGFVGALAALGLLTVLV